MTDTEFKLLNWRGDSLNAERMCADILVMQDYESVDPQCPLGGPDGTKDLLCRKGGWSYVGAVYFAPIPKTFKSIKAKFIGDYKGVAKNKADGIIFMTNQKLTPSNKKALQNIADKDKAKCIIFDNEALRALLDSALGLPIRLQHLKIKLSEDEQLAFFSKQQNKLPQLFDFYSKGIIDALCAKIDECCEMRGQEKEVLDEIYSFAQRTMAYMQDVPPKSDKAKLVFPKSIDISTRKLDSKILKFIHKIMLYETGSPELGEFRTHQVWIGSPKSSPEKAAYIPPKPEQVFALTEKLLSKWREDYDKILSFKSKKQKIEKIAWFHSEFLRIHPFLDGNGRVARFILNQQISEMLNVNRHVIIEDRPSYFDALNESQKHNYEPLIKIITQAVYGNDTIE